MDVREKLVEQLLWWSNECDRTNFGCQASELLVAAANYIAHGVTVQGVTDNNVGCKWISVEERLPENYISVLGYMTDAGEFPPVRECYTVGNAFFFPALADVHPVSHWCEMPEPPKGE